MGRVAGWDVCIVLDELETEVLRACSREGEWPARIAAGVCAGVDFAIARPAVAGDLAMDPSRPRPYDGLIARLAGFMRVNAPTENRLPAAADEALVAGIVSLVGDHLRVGRVDRLAALRPELVLLALLPYVGFDEARAWANRVAGEQA